MELIIDQVTPENSGQYLCEAMNDYGGTQNELTIRVVSAPKVFITPSKLENDENSRAFLECSVKKQHDEKCLISWIFDGKIVERV